MLRETPSRYLQPDMGTVPSWLPGIYLVSSLVVVVGSVAEALSEGSDQSWHALGGVILMLVVAGVHAILRWTGRSKQGMEPT